MFTIDRKMLYLLLLCVGILGLQNVYAQWADPGYAQWDGVPTWGGPGYVDPSGVPAWDSPGYVDPFDIPTWGGPGYDPSGIPTWGGPGYDPSGIPTWDGPGYDLSGTPTWGAPLSVGAINQGAYSNSSLTAQGLWDETGVPNGEAMRDSYLRHKQRMIIRTRAIAERENRERWEREDRQREVEAIYRDMRLKNPHRGKPLNSREQIEALRTEVRYRRNNPRPESRVIRVNPSVTNIDRIDESRRR